MNSIPKTKVGLDSPLLYRFWGNDGSPWKGEGRCEVGASNPLWISPVTLARIFVCLVGFGSTDSPPYVRIFSSYRVPFSFWCVGFSLWWFLLLQIRGSRHLGSVVAVHLLSCPKACGIFPNQESNSCPLNWQTNSYLLDHQGSLNLQTFMSIDITILMRIYIKILY